MRQFDIHNKAKNKITVFSDPALEQIQKSIINNALDSLANEIKIEQLNTKINND